MYATIQLVLSRTNTLLPPYGPKTWSRTSSGRDLHFTHHQNLVSHFYHPAKGFRSFTIIKLVYPAEIYFRWF